MGPAERVGVANLEDELDREIDTGIGVGVESVEDLVRDSELRDVGSDLARDGAAPHLRDLVGHGDARHHRTTDVVVRDQEACRADSGELIEIADNEADTA